MACGTSAPPILRPMAGDCEPLPLVPPVPEPDAVLALEEEAAAAGVEGAMLFDAAAAADPEAPDPAEPDVPAEADVAAATKAALGPWTMIDKLAVDDWASRLSISKTSVARIPGETT